MPNPKGAWPKIHESAFIAPGATIIGNVEIGEETNVWPGAVIRGDLCKITIGARCSIQDNAVIHSEAGTSLYIGNDVLIAHGAIVHGPGDVGNNNLIGIGAIKLMGKKIGDGCIIGSASVVTKDVPDYSKIMGVPGEVKGETGPEETTPDATGSARYVQLGQDYKKKGFDERAHLHEEET